MIYSLNSILKYWLWTCFLSVQNKSSSFLTQTNRMEASHELTESPFTRQLSTLDNQMLDSNTLIYRTFATKPIDSFLGTSLFTQASPSKNNDFMLYKKKPFLCSSSLLDIKMPAAKRPPFSSRKSSSPFKSPNTSSLKSTFASSPKTKPKYETMSSKKSSTLKATAS